MKAAFINKTGPPEEIVYGDLPDPVPAPGESLIRVGAVSVNPIDTYLRQGTIPGNLPFPFVVGCDFAGTILKPGGSRFRAGDRVWGSNQGLLGRQGTFAEQIVVGEDWIHPTPAEVSDETAAAVALVGITAHLGLVQHARVQAGETLFVHGGSGGVGSMVVQMAKAFGCRVITTAGNPDKARICRELGADHVIEYRTGNVAEAVKELAPAGVNVWWETLREPDFDLAISLMAARGRMILMAGRDARPLFPVGPFYVKQCSLHGFVMFLATPQEQRLAAEQINAWLREGRLRARIDRVLPLAETAAAHRLQQESTVGKSGGLQGKIVLKP